MSPRFERGDAEGLLDTNQTNGARYVRVGEDMFSTTSLTVSADNLLEEMRSKGINGPEEDRGTLLGKTVGILVWSFAKANPDEALRKTVDVVKRSSRPGVEVNGISQHSKPPKH